MLPSFLPFSFSLTQVSSAAASSYSNGPPTTIGAREITGFNWSQIQPHPFLQWHKCYESFECARLQVPLDWNNRSNPNTVAIAVTRLPAVVARNDPTFGKSILLNPGGPGGSGVDEVLWHGFKIRDTIVDSSDKHFEIIGFDPRGVHHTTPSVLCFGDDWLRQVWLYRNWASGQLGSSEWCLNFKWAAYKSLADLCEARNSDQLGDGTNMHQFVSTALTARDMLAIVDALQAETLNYPKGRHANQIAVATETEPDLLQYWGFSYGTFLGNTFASMFPNRVGNLVLDGNVDPYDYAATGWLKNLFDSNKNLHWFYYSCFHAREKCALYDSNTTSLFDIEKKVLHVLDELYQNPVAVTTYGADIVTYYDLTNLFFGAAYAPLYFWPDVAEAVKGLLEGNGTAIVKYLKDLKIPQPDPTNPKPPNDPNTFSLDNNTLPYPPDYVGGLEGAISVLCGDGESLYELTKHDWEIRLAELNNQSLVAGPFWLTIPFACHHWPASLRPAERSRFVGPFASQLVDYDPRGSPILFIGNTADPVTPLRNAVSNSKSHEGSRVLTQDSPGHCSGPVNPSKCTFEVIRAYFRNGTLPEEGKVCVADRSPWDEA